MGRSRPPSTSREKASEPVPSSAPKAGSDEQSTLIEAMRSMMKDLTASMADLRNNLQHPIREGQANSERENSSLNGNQSAAGAKAYPAQGMGYGSGNGSGPGQGFGTNLLAAKIQLERYAGIVTKTLPQNWMRSYESMAVIQQWSGQQKATMLRFYLADDAVTWLDNQFSQGIYDWTETKQRFEKYFNQDKVVTPKMVISKEWEPKESSFYERYEEMMRLFDISGMSENWRTQVLKTSLPPYYARMCSGVETHDTDEWYQRAVSIISSLPKYDGKPTNKSNIKAITAVQDIKTLATIVMTRQTTRRWRDVAL